MNHVEVVPSARILVSSMRSIGYTLETAIADIIDNSISAGATKIEIHHRFLTDLRYIAVVDNGIGMTWDELVDALRWGSKDPAVNRANDDLGRFGLGMKTASFSQCRHLTVVSKRKGVTSIAGWNLDHVEQTDKWEIERPVSIAGIPHAEDLGDNGTLVLWEDLDRLTNLGEEREVTDYFDKRMGDAEDHLSLVFHRFMVSERGYKKITFKRNGHEIQPLDPFHSDHPATIREPAKPEKIKVDNVELSFQAFTLPHHKKVSSADWDKYAFPGGYLRNQGFYVYRERRLIIHGTWFNLARQQELTKLCRVRIDMPNTMDELWKVDVRKSWAQPPLLVRKRLRTIIERLVTPSRRTYARRGLVTVTDERVPVWNRVVTNDRIHYQVNAKHPSLCSYVNLLSDDQSRAFGRVLDLLSASIPLDTIILDTGTSPDQLESGVISNAALKDAALQMSSALLGGGMSWGNVLIAMKASLPFSENWERTEIILNDMKDELSA